MQIIQDVRAVTEAAKPQAQTAPPSPAAPAGSPQPSSGQVTPLPSPAAVPLTPKPVAPVRDTGAAPPPANTAPPVKPVVVPPAAAPAPAPTPPEAVRMRPVAGPAKLKQRHYGIMWSFAALVLLPVVLSAFYLFAVARDQYASRAGFTIRQEDGNSASSILGGLSFLAGASQGVNTGVLHEYMQSQSMMEQVDNRIDLREHYGQAWPSDPVFSIWPDASKEDLFGFWKRVLRLSYDSSSGLIDLEIHAFDPVTAQAIVQVILEESQNMINRLNDTSRRDAMVNADRELTEAVANLRSAREALTVFRATTRIVDPVADIQGRLGVVSNLQQQLAQSLVELDLLDPSTRVDDPRREQLNRRISVIRNRIDQERNFFGATSDVSAEESYPEMIARYEGLSVDLEFAQRNYTAALAAQQVAMSNASRQSLYLAAYIPPTQAEESEYPQRFTLLMMILGFALMAWATVALVYYSLRDRG